MSLNLAVTIREKQILLNVLIINQIRKQHVEPLLARQKLLNYMRYIYV